MIEDYIDIKKGTINYKMLSIYNRVEEEILTPFTLDDQEIQKIFSEFYDEISDLKECYPQECEKLETLLIQYIIPMLTDQQALQEYKNQAYTNLENEHREMRREEQNERDFACENGMEPEYWCQKCNVGICDLH